MTIESTGLRRRPSMDEVARAAGVSKAAVSKVIRDAYGVSPAMRERVEATIKELGYRPRIAARAMRGSSFSIGLEIPNLGNEFFTQVMQGATQQLSGSGYQLMIAPGLGEMSGTKVLENLADRQVDGLVAISPQVTPEWLEELGQDVPLVLLGRHDASASYDTLTNDDEAGTQMALAHLRALGHTAIAHLTLHTADDDWLSPHAVRRHTYEALMIEAREDPLVVLVRPDGDDAYELAVELIRSGTATAIFAGNDTLAIDALRAVADLGKTTKDVSIVGYDGIQLAEHPLISLTTVNQHGAQMGAAAVNLLMERILQGRAEAKHEQLQPVLEERESTHPRG